MYHISISTIYAIHTLRWRKFQSAKPQTTFSKQGLCKDCDDPSLSHCSIKLNEEPKET